MDADQMTIMPESDIAGILAGIVGAEAVLTSDAQRVFFATDVASRGVAAEAVVSVGDTGTLARVVCACTAAGRIVIPRGGGFSYSGGYTPTMDRAVIVDLRKMDRIVEINERDLYVVVECGCTWEKLYTALKARGLRTPYFGPMSGYRATVGGALSQGSFFLGSTQHGTVAESVLGLEVVLADGTVLHTGSGASTEGALPFFRQYGPDPTGMFLSDTGAMGFKTRAVLRLMPFPAAQAYGSFAFTDHRPALAALSEIARGGLAAECYCWDPYFVERVMANTAGTTEDLRFLLNVVKAGSGLVDGLGAAARIALAGRRAFGGRIWLLHVVIDDVTQEGAAARLKLVRALTRKSGGREVSPSAPRTLRGTPFTDFNTQERKATLGNLRNLPINSLSSHSRAPAVAEEVYRFIDDEKAAMDAAGLNCGVIFFAVGAQSVSIEPLIYWDDEEHALHDRVSECSDMDALSRFSDRPSSTRAAMAMRDGLKQIFRKHACVHVQIGRAYPWAETRDPALLKLVRAFKDEVDPEHLVNRGSLALGSGGK